MTTMTTISTGVSKRLITVDEYMKMIDTGIIREGEKVELIEGELIQMAGIESPHWAVVANINSLFSPRVNKPLTKRLLTVDDYDKMIETEIIRPYERVELIEGEIIRTRNNEKFETLNSNDFHVAMNSPHSACLARVNYLLHQAFAKDAIIFSQQPIRLGDYSEPEPDAALLAFKKNFYVDTKPTEADVRLLIEISDTTLTTDKRSKLPLYARFGISEVWIVNLRAMNVEVYREPLSGNYGNVKIYKSGETVSPSQFPDAQFSINDIFGIDSESSNAFNF
jgi:Uma2 family endonuclease